MRNNKQVSNSFLMFVVFITVLFGVLVSLGGCVTVKHTAGQRGTPYFWTERTTVVGTAEIQKVAQNFQGSLSVKQGANGPEVTVGLTSGQNAEGIKTTELIAIRDFVSLLNNLSKIGSPF